ncbi:MULTISPECIES: hypothetical protein [Limibacillus]|uniref:Uncharacterized protein n=1 Tax=Limibacillus halophilus TaxID=1579333 RepID=A0A839SWB0_9PROT|nr:hypothetical protein [Limibacillus halophilus]MBB3065245.1 hypothetical protein [Limibacillus halophilus]
MRSEIYQEVARATRIQRLEIRYKGVGALLIATLVCLSTLLTFTIGFAKAGGLLGGF